MTHANEFWDRKLPENRRWKFWELVKFGFSGETAYHRTLDKTYD